MKANKQKNYFNMKKASAERGEIHIYGDIINEDWRWENDTSAVSFRDELAALGDVEVIDLRINSGGGDVFEASSIYNMLKRHKARIEVHIDGLAASAASVIAMAGDKVSMPKNSMLMIHNAWTITMGNHNDLRKAADEIEKISASTVKQSYLDKNPEIKADEISRLMDEETWLTADEALAMGLIDEVTSLTQVAASLTDEQIARYKNAPSALIEPQPIENAEIESMKQQIAELTAQINKPKEPEQEPAKQANLSRLFLNL
ncbi:head maturation protease, ClpP-related [Sporosarcina sp. A2]|uniref:head maturation protease, ClpP-related n=1 Tax=Sporosarcina sp. A2 TaxID=3393449 RepID=UPI003D7A1327